MRPIILMKPGEENQQIAAFLVAQGVSSDLIHLWPAFQIEPPEELQNVRLQLLEAARDSLIVIVSPSAVFQIARIVHEWPTNTCFACVGEATATAIKQTWGNEFSVTYPQGGTLASGSEELFKLITQKKLPKKVLLARGQTGREWLAEHLRDRGVQVKVLVVYRRTPLKLPEEELSWINKADYSPVLYLTSSEAVDILLENVRQRPEAIEYLRQGVVVSIHPRITEKLTQAGFLYVQQTELKNGDLAGELKRLASIIE